ncbi:hypothetical protein Tco_0606633 [Tanacetum coccineum]
MCCDDAYLVMPRDSALARYDRLVSEPGYREEPIEEEPLKEPKEEALFDESEEEANSDLLSDARSKPRPTESGRCDCLAQKLSEQTDSYLSLYSISSLNYLGRLTTHPYSLVDSGIAQSTDGQSINAVHILFEKIFGSEWLMLPGRGVLILKNIAPVARLEAVRIFCAYAATDSLF